MTRSSPNPQGKRSAEIKMDKNTKIQNNLPEDIRLKKLKAIKVKSIKQNIRARGQEKTCAQPNTGD